MALTPFVMICLLCTKTCVLWTLCILLALQNQNLRFMDETLSVKYHHTVSIQSVVIILVKLSFSKTFKSVTPFSRAAQMAKNYKNLQIIAIN